jgi:hypothetical protein
LSVASPASLRIADIRTIIDDDPSLRSSRDTRHADAVALVPSRVSWKFFEITAHSALTSVSYRYTQVGGWAILLHSSRASGNGWMCNDGSEKPKRKFHDTRRIHVKGKETRLTPKEFDLLHYLVSQAGKPVAHRELLQAVWGPDYDYEPQYLRVIINQLRKKIEPNPTKPKYILTEPWIGYRFAASADAQP